MHSTGPKWRPGRPKPGRRPGAAGSGSRNHVAQEGPQAENENADAEQAPLCALNSIVEFARVDPTTLFAPLPVAGPAPKPKQPERVTREPKEGTSGFFFRERFWDLPIDEQKTKLQRVNRDPALKMEWENITSAMRAPREVIQFLSESEKAKSIRTARRTPAQ